MTPETMQQTLQRALRHHGAGEFEQAAVIYRDILSDDPENAVALNLLGVIAHQTGRHEEAIQLIGEAIHLRPNVADFHANLGQPYLSLGDEKRAADCFAKALSRDPRSTAALSGMGQLRKKQNRFDEAAKHFRALLEIRPLAVIWTKLAEVLALSGKFPEAHDAYQSAIRLDSAHPVIRAGLGMLFHMEHRYEEAIATHRDAIRRGPNYDDAYVNLAGSLLAQGRTEEAIANYREAMSINPKHAVAHSNLLMAMHYLPFDREEMFREHVKWADAHAAGLAREGFAFTNDRDPDRRLRIGYVSPDFRQHSMAFFLEPIVGAHDRSAVEVFCYSNVPRPDEVTKRFQRHADQWRDVSGISDEQLCRQIGEDAIDILIDLPAHTAGNRLLAFARRPAPVQVTYQSYPDTTGLRVIDYRLTDSIADPAGADAFCSEKLIRLPTNWCYQPTDPSPHHNALPAKETGVITFGSANALAKLSPFIIEVWSKVLAAVPNSRMLIKAAALGEQATVDRLKKAFAACGVADQRLLFRGRDETVRDHLRVYHDIDIALDTFPYHGTTTTCDALWMGVPVVTLAGEAHVARVGASLLTTVGLAECIATSVEEFTRIAAALAGDVKKLAKIRGTLRQTMQKSPLMDAAGMVRAMEQAYRAMWHRYVGETD